MYSDHFGPALISNLNSLYRQSPSEYQERINGLIDLAKQMNFRFCRVENISNADKKYVSDYVLSLGYKFRILPDENQGYVALEISIKTQNKINPMYSAREARINSLKVKKLKRQPIFVDGDESPTFESSVQRIAERINQAVQNGDDSVQLGPIQDRLYDGITRHIAGYGYKVVGMSSRTLIEVSWHSAEI
jgi:hypothetical protein